MFHFGFPPSSPLAGALLKFTRNLLCFDFCYHLQVLILAAQEREVYIRE